MRKFILLLSLTIASSFYAKADEGMWLLTCLGKNAKTMQRAGLKLSPEEIYSANHNSLKDAIIIFGGGCTGEVVSSNGLIFTNHHCGYGAVHALSTMEHNWLKNGFWAKTHQEELPAKGLKVVFIKKIIDVTDQINEIKKSGFSEKEIEKNITAKQKELIDSYTDESKNLSASIIPMFAGNQFILFVKETFGDIRLVGVPPESIGKYGGDTDNWMWPRHTGDFSIFRIYADKNGNSTKDFVADNIPYKPSKYLKVSTKGYKEGDFAMIMGFPGSTDRYMTTWEIDSKLNISDPIRIFVRGEKQDIWKKDMLNSEKIRLQYSNKFASSSNYWKNSIGMSRGIRKLHLKERKQTEQEDFTNWVNNGGDERIKEYGQALNLLEQGTKEADKSLREMLLYRECINGAEAIKFATNLNLKNDVKKLRQTAERFFENYNASTDKKTTTRMLEILIDSLRDNSFLEPLKNNFTALVDNFFSSSIFTDSARFYNCLNSDTYKVLLSSDTIVNIINKFDYDGLLDKYYKGIKLQEQGRYLYEKGLLENARIHYPNANGTIRLTYGNVKSYYPADAIHYNYFTTLYGVVAKEDKNNPEFELYPKLRSLCNAHDYGRWVDRDGTLHVNFLTTNDITGGNSGSPVMDAKGNLIGLAFDGNWEAMSGDVAFEPELQRCICVDIRYVLFIIDKVAGATNIIDELTLI